MRKRIVVHLSVMAAICFLIGIDAHALTLEKGTISLGGSSDMSLGRSDSNLAGDMDSFRVSLESGYFVLDNLEIGGAVCISWASTDQSDYTGYTLSPFLTYHFPFNEHSNFYLTGRLGYVIAESEFEDHSIDTDGTMWALGAGWEYFFNRYVAATISLDYSDTEFESEGDVTYVGPTDESTTSFGLNFGLRVYFW